MTPESQNALDKARNCLHKARLVLAIELGDEAGRNAYLAAFHAARAFIFEKTRKTTKTHNGVQALFNDLVRNRPDIPEEFSQFLSRAYNLKAIADYEEGDGAPVSPEKAAAAIETAERFVNCITEVLADSAVATHNQNQT